jgi:hypothetical protein
MRYVWAIIGAVLIVLVILNFTGMVNLQYKAASWGMK